jgi:H+/Cl- antiporter ClcA
MLCVFCGVVNCPLTALLLGCSLFGYSGAPYFFLACAISYALSGYTGLYAEQTILYSKFRPQFINKRTE